jgi:hypothetical protein
MFTGDPSSNMTLPTKKMGRSSSGLFVVFVPLLRLLFGLRDELFDGFVDVPRVPEPADGALGEPAPAPAPVPLCCPSMCGALLASIAAKKITPLRLAHLDMEPPQ